MDVKIEIDRLRLLQKQQKETIIYLTNVNEELAIKIDTVKREITKKRASTDLTNFQIAQYRELMQNHREKLYEIKTSKLDEMEYDEDEVEKRNNEIKKVFAIVVQKENTIKSMSEDISKIEADCISIEKDRIKNREEKMKKIEELIQKMKEKNKDEKHRVLYS